MKTENRIKIIGLCGRSGSGKGFLCSLFRQAGVPSVDTDRVYHDMMKIPVTDDRAVCLREITEYFGPGVLSEDGTLDRKKLAAVVFDDSGEGREKLSELNRITHKYILGQTDRIIEEYEKEGFDAVLVDAPLLFESGYDAKCDHIIMADAPDSVLIRRIMKRDGISREKAEERLASQISPEELRERSDFCVDMHRKAADIMPDIEKILEKIRGGTIETET